MIAVISLPFLATERMVQTICAVVDRVAGYSAPPFLLDLDAVDYPAFAASYGEWKASGRRVLLAHGTTHLLHLMTVLRAEGVFRIVCADYRLALKCCRAAPKENSAHPLRHCSRSLAILHSIAADDAELLIVPGRSVRESARLLGRFPSAMEAEILSSAEGAAESFASSDDIAGPLDGDDARSDGRRVQQSMVEALGSLSSRPGSVQKHELRWPKTLFYDGSHFGPYTAKHIELTGRARVLLYGPYMHLPRGKWIAILELRLTENLSGNAFHIDVFNGAILAVGRLEVPRDGRFLTHIPFTIDDPNLAVEVRISSERGAIEGSFDLPGVQVVESEPARFVDRISTGRPLSLSR